MRGLVFLQVKLRTAGQLRVGGEAPLLLAEQGWSASLLVGHRWLGSFRRWQLAESTANPSRQTSATYNMKTSWSAPSCSAF